MSFTVLGTDLVTAALARIGIEVDVALTQSLEEGAQVLRDAWVDNITGEGLVLTGNYRDSVHVVKDGEEVAVTTDVPYAAILEYGDSRQAAHPVAERAFDEHHEQATKIVGQRVEEVVR